MTTPTIERPVTATTFVERAREIVPLLRAEADGNEHAGALSPATVAALQERDLLRVLASAARGESAAGVVDCTEIVETIASGDGSAGWDAFASMGGNIIAGFLPAGSLEAIFATPADWAATAIGRLGKAVAVDGGYLIDARWPFLSGSPHASWIGGICMVYDGDQPRMLTPGQPHVIMALLRRERVTLLGNWDTTGLRATGSQEAEVMGAFVPFAEVADFAGGVRPGLPLLFSVDENVAAPIVGAAVALGIAQNAITAFRESMHGRTHQSGVPATEAALPRYTLARAEGHLELARGGIYAVARGIDDEIADGRLPDESWITRASLAATAAVEVTIALVEDLYRAAGSSAVFAGSALERAFRDIHTMGAHRLFQRENYLVHGEAVMAG